MPSPSKVNYVPVSDHISEVDGDEEDILNASDDDILLQPLSNTFHPTSPNLTSIGPLQTPRHRHRPSPNSKASPNEAQLSPRSSNEEDEDSPARLVAKVVPETDDPSLPTSTLRVWLIGSLLGGIGAGVNQIFFFKSNGVGFGGFFIVLISYPSQSHFFKPPVS